MSWFARLISPSKRRAKDDEATLPPNKKSRTLEEDILGSKAPALAYPFSKKDPYYLRPDSEELGSVLGRSA